MKILKFGGKSLDNGSGILTVLDIIIDNYRAGEAPVVVVSARGKSTDALLALAEQACAGEPYGAALQAFWEHQCQDTTLRFEAERVQLERLLSGISLLGECSPRTADELVSYGEVLSSQYVAQALKDRGYEAVAIDSGDFLVTDAHYGSASVFTEISRERCRALFAGLPAGVIPIVTGFIARDEAGRRTTLGRNGSNYSAALLANFLEASLMENYTHVDGIYTANPSVVAEARKIDELSYADAAELSQFGAEILHIKTIEPLQEQGIPLRVLNTFSYGEESNGTLVTAHPRDKVVRALASLSGKALIHFEGRNMLGRSGIDARIFRSFEAAEVSVSLIAQGSTERGTAIVVDEEEADRAVEALVQEFHHDLETGHVTKIYAEKGLAVVAIIGLNLLEFDRPYRALVRNRILPILLSNSVPENTLCLLVRDDEEREKALKVIHGELFERPKRIHLAVIGHGTVGGAFIGQIIQQRELLIAQKNIDLRIFAIADSRHLLLSSSGAEADWATELERAPFSGDLAETIISYGQRQALENMILVDNTSSPVIASHYARYAAEGFDIVSSNKKANIAPYADYSYLRDTLQRHRRSYRYETNVGAGLPLIDNLKLLHLSGERITRIHGLFSGSLSYIFNRLTEEPDRSLRSIVEESARLGLTEPDPREDLSGEDVARKVLILVRELDVPAELTDVRWENPVPEALRSLSLEDFWARFGELEASIEALRATAKPDEVLRYVGDIVWDDVRQEATLSAGLRLVSRTSPLGRVSGADSCFEIYTESYGSQPIVIQGAGAGAAVTARGVFGDVLRLAEGYES
ncbi:MAG: aspartate kinase [Porphyromonas pasteri]